MEFYDVTEWQSALDAPKGTRSKEILINPGNHEKYFLKFPLKKENRDYSPETWSEIIAYEVGFKLGFNVLRYDLAIRNSRLGCISRNMISSDEEELIEGDNILHSYDNFYDPNDKRQYNKYTVNFVTNAIEKFAGKKWVDKFLEVLVFDAIIGNSDRHQSNWGFIRSIKYFTLPKFLKFLNKNPIIMQKIYFSPIYDSGCSLGRELSDEQIRLKLNDRNSFNSFIRKGKAELRSDISPNKKLNHIELLDYICKENRHWKHVILKVIKRVKKKYSKEKLAKMISNLDTTIPEDVRYIDNLSEDRKNFIIQLLDHRINNLFQLCSK